MNDPVMEAFDIFADAVEAQLSGMREEIAALKESKPVTIHIDPVAPAPPAMQRTSPDYTSPGFVEAVRHLVQNEPPDGAVKAFIDKALAEGLAAFPIPKDGKDGDNGADSLVPGPKGDKGERGEPGIGEKGDPGPKGDPGSDSVVPGPKGDRGADGVGISETRLVNGDLMVTFTNGTERNLGRVEGIPGRDAKGDPGKDGKDGISPEQLRELLATARAEGAADMLASIEFDGRTWKIGERQVRTPSPEYRGVWKEGETYTRGDMVTWASQIWHCNTETTEKPGDTNPQWTLAVRKGRDARDRTS